MKQTLNLAIIGYGIAGKAREKAISQIASVNLVSIVTKQKEFSTHSLEEVLSDQNITGVCISTENTRHFELIKTSLNHNKHVLCDYPLAFSKKDIESLFHLAQEKGLILQAEHIGLLMQSHIEIKQKIDSLNPIESLKSGEYLFTGNWNGKLFDKNYTGPHQFLAYSRLIQIWNLFGPFEIKEYEFKVDQQEFQLNCDLKFQNGAVINFSEKRQPDLKRKRSFDIEINNEKISWTPHPERGLFQKDVEIFINSISDKNHQKNYVALETILGVTAQLEKIQ